MGVEDKKRRGNEKKKWERQGEGGVDYKVIGAEKERLEKNNEGWKRKWSGLVKKREWVRRVKGAGWKRKGSKLEEKMERIGREK